ncbi:type II secretion system GspH family protein, partial [Patescibacteria group bacterium]|nr:type II secretion system GspH family protein [Patescibacteria group bacterium]
MNYWRSKNNKKGFTLIELLVVIAIIGLLASIVLVSLNSARAKARDARRKADLNQIRLALEMYYDSYNRYPQAGSCGYGTNCYVYSTAGSSWIPALVSGGYMSTMSIDPKNNANGPWSTGNYSYAYGNVDTNGQSFDLTAQLENTSDNDRCAIKCYKFYF